MLLGRQIRADDGFRERCVFLRADSKPAEDPKHVRIHNDAGHFVACGRHEVRGLPSHAGQFEHLFESGRNVAPKPCFKRFGRIDDVPRLDMEEAHGVDDPFDFGDVSQGELLGGRKAAEELAGHHIDLFVRRLGTQNHRDEELKAAVIVQKGVSVRPEGREPPVDFLEKKGRGLGRSGHL